MCGEIARVVTVDAIGTSEMEYRGRYGDENGERDTAPAAVDRCVSHGAISMMSTISDSPVVSSCDMTTR